MKKLLKVLLGFVGALVLVMILAAVILPLAYNSDDIKSAIAAQVHKQTGRELAIDGELKFSVFPWLAVEVSRLSLSNAPGFGERELARIDRARVGVALTPLFRKQLVADEVTLEGLLLSLEVNAQGQNNWDDLGADRKQPVPSAPTGPGMFSSGRIAGLKILDAQAEFRDRQTGSHYRIERFSLETGALQDGEPVELTTAMILEDVAAGNRLDLQLTATAASDFSSNRHTLEAVRLDFRTVARNGGTGNILTMRAPRLQADIAAQTLDLDAFTFTLAGATGAGQLKASRILDQPNFTGKLSVEEFSPSHLIQDLGFDAPVTSDPRVLQRARFAADFSGGSSQARLENLELELDQSLFSGELNLLKFNPPVLRFEFKVDRIDIDRYLMPASKEDIQTEDLAIPGEQLRDQDVQGSLRVKALHVAGLDFNDAVVGLNINQGKLRIDPLSAGFYSGTYSGNITLDGSGAEPVLSLDQNLDSVTLQNLIAAASNTESLSGMAVGHARLSSRGATSSAILGNLQGDVDLSLSDGALEGINIWYEIRRGLALFNGRPPPPGEPNRTVFTRMQFKAAVKDGVINSRELLGELPFLTLSGSGSVDLGKSTVDMRMVANVRNMPELSQDPLSAELRGKQLPFRISGSLADPGLSVDWAALLKGEATNILLDKLGFTPGSVDPGEPQDSAALSDGEKPAELKKPKDQARDLLRNFLGPKNKDPKDMNDSDGDG